MTQRMLARLFYTLSFMTLFYPGAVSADYGEWMVGGHTTAHHPVAVTVGGVGRLGLGDYAWLSVDGGIGGWPESLQSDLGADLVFDLDIFKWVPEVLVGAAYSRADERSKPWGRAQLGVRYFTGFTSSWGLYLGAEHDFESCYRGLLRLVYWHTGGVPR